MIKLNPDSFERHDSPEEIRIKRAYEKLRKAFLPEKTAFNNGEYELLFGDKGNILIRKIDSEPVYIIYNSGKVFSTDIEGNNVVPADANEVIKIVDALVGKDEADR